MPATPRDFDDVRWWARRAPDVPAAWFLRPDRADGIHGARHIRRVHILADRLSLDLGWDETARRRLLAAALWHDIGRTNDGVEPGHGHRSAERVLELGLDRTLEAPDDREVALFAVRHHVRDKDEARAARAAAQTTGATRATARATSRTDPAPRDAAGPSRPPGTPPLPEHLRGAAHETLRALKDADALDRIRLGRYDLDPSRLRFARSHELIDFARRLYATL